MKPDVCRVGRTAIGVLSVVLCMAGVSHGETRNRIAVSADGVLLAAASRGTLIHLYLADTLKHAGRIEPPSASSCEVGLSPDGAMLAASGKDELTFFETSTGKRVSQYATNGPVAFSDDGRWCLAREESPKKNGLLIDMTTGQVMHRVENVRGLGFSPDGKHFVTVREWRESSQSKEVKVLMTRYAISNAKAEEPIEIQAKAPDAHGHSIRPIPGGYVLERGGHVWTVREDGATTDEGLFKPSIYSGAPGLLLLAAENALVNGKQGFAIGWGRTVSDLKAGLSPEKRTFLQLTDNPDLPEGIDLEVFDLTLANRHYYLANQLGSVMKVQPDGKVVAYGAYDSPVDATALPGKRPPETSAADSDSALAEVSVTAPPSGAVARLEPGVKRLSGSVAAKVKEVGEELAGASFTVVPWKSSPEYVITVTRPGYLYFLKGSQQEREKLGPGLEHRPDAVSGAFLAGAYRIKVNKDQQFTIGGYELSIVAGKIELK